MNRWDGTNAMIGTTNGTSGWKWTKDGNGRNRMDGPRTSKKLNKNEINGNYFNNE